MCLRTLIVSSATRFEFFFLSLPLARVSVSFKQTCHQSVTNEYEKTTVYILHITSDIRYSSRSVNVSRYNVPWVSHKSAQHSSTSSHFSEYRPPIGRYHNAKRSRKPSLRLSRFQSRQGGYDVVIGCPACPLSARRVSSVTWRRREQYGELNGVKAEWAGSTKREVGWRLESGDCCWRAGGWVGMG